MCIVSSNEKLYWLYSFLYETTSMHDPQTSSCEFMSLSGWKSQNCREIHWLHLLNWENDEPQWEHSRCTDTPAVLAISLRRTVQTHCSWACFKNTGSHMIHQNWLVEGKVEYSIMPILESYIPSDLRPFLHFSPSGRCSLAGRCGTSVEWTGSNWRSEPFQPQDLFEIRSEQSSSTGPKQLMCRWIK